MACASLATVGLLSVATVVACARMWMGDLWWVPLLRQVATRTLRVARRALRRVLLRRALRRVLLRRALRRVLLRRALWRVASLRRALRRVASLRRALRRVLLRC